ncbi:hypothetical protein BAUCODRAFT_491041 [Baudoinia panamericana UAMH 10762]|uniref:Myb-like domain-containing protein n=1 Tax=Baudoinia panamericana (strain UAMH 10762) TaxID=717646 RepID=M2ND36_BAUPA|nr:uncharacterized protein BAUCODRAFT_491041 [Baudoinia panamericana UAMH 10762]EMC96835.1 hypothetical protein BAUCODRAFT_491041 [Baudoinia panamericana UAMH 10762]
MSPTPESQTSPLPASPDRNADFADASDRAMAAALPSNLRGTPLSSRAPFSSSPAPLPRPGPRSGFKLNTGAEFGRGRPPKKKANTASVVDDEPTGSRSTCQKRAGDDGVFARPTTPASATAESKRTTASKAEGGRKRKAATGPREVPAKAIPLCYDDCEPFDKMLVDMRAENKPWPEIREAWNKLTGHKAPFSSLPNRYARMMINFTVIKEEDKPKMLEAKQEIEREFEEVKWEKIAERVAEKGGDAYKGGAICRLYKKIMAEANIMPPEGVRDGDFEVDSGDE